MNKISIQKILTFTPAQEEFSKYIFNGRLGKCLFYIDDVAFDAYHDIVNSDYANDPNIGEKYEMFVDRGLPIGRMNQAMIDLANPKDKADLGKPFIFATSSVFALRMFQQSLIMVVSKNKGKLKVSQPTGRIFLSNINDTIDWLYPGKVLNNWCEPVNRLIDKVHVVNGRKTTKKNGRPEYDHGTKPQITDFDRKLIGQIGDSFLRITLERYIGLSDHFPRDEEYDEAIHGIEVSFSQSQLYASLSKK